MDEMGNEHPYFHRYEMTTGNDNQNDNFVLRLQPNHTHFHFFDDGKDGTDGINDLKNMLLKRQEIERELSINKALMSPVVGYQPKSIGMCFRY
jgi:hypothetical protein